jgi:hypothetical protein
LVVVDAPYIEAEQAEDKRGGRRTVLYIAIGIVAILLIAVFGWYQFEHRTKAPIDTVKTHAMYGTDITIGEGILDFLGESGIKVVNEGFKPMWGAEEKDSGVWVVSYVFEVGRQSNRLSWKVDTRTGRVTPLDNLAQVLWEEK